MSGLSVYFKWHHRNLSGNLRNFNNEISKNTRKLRAWTPKEPSNKLSPLIFQPNNSYFFLKGKSSLRFPGCPQETEWQEVPIPVTTQVPSHSGLMLLFYPSWFATDLETHTPTKKTRRFDVSCDVGADPGCGRYMFGITIWLVLSDEPISKRWPLFSIIFPTKWWANEQLGGGVKHLPAIIYNS